MRTRVLLRVDALALFQTSGILRGDDAVDVSLAQIADPLLNMKDYLGSRYLSQILPKVLSKSNLSILQGDIRLESAY